jgi:hypothetical protein
MMRITRIPIRYTSSEALSYDYVERRYYRIKSPGEIKAWQPGLLYFIALPLALALSHTVDDMTASLRSEEVSLFLIVLVNVLTGLLLGRMLTSMLHSLTWKRRGEIVPCRDGEVVESCHFIVDGIREFQRQCSVLMVFVGLGFAFGLFVFMTASGVILAFLLALIVATIVVLVSTIHPIMKLRFFVERAGVLRGHDIDSFLGKFIYRLYLRYSKTRI